MKKIPKCWYCLDSLDSYFTNDASLEIKKNETVQLSFGIIEPSVLGYDVIVPSNHFINDKFSFPLLATLYSPNIIFPEPLELYNFELLEYSSFDIETSQMIHSVCLEPEIDTDYSFDGFFINSKNSLNDLEVIP